MDNSEKERHLVDASDLDDMHDRLRKAVEAVRRIGKKRSIGRTFLISRIRCTRSRDTKYE